eukprot:NODE_10217_length_1368_cov_3.606769.p1 GENE.NODE_10217_length_1368_cov_3.606769~~NODE_10217_length_1368_cov_3.606769.p1  ORF type:complete len:311 (-),score=105.03 NODE_10217_length_1368_cov_3.606769:64-996(-)
MLQCSAAFSSASFENAHLCSEDAGRIVQAFQGCDTLLSLNLRGNRLVGPAIRVVSKLLHENPVLKHLNLEATDLLPDSAEALAESLKRNTNLLELKLASNFIGEAGALHMALMLRINQTLVYLDLHGNDMDIDGGKFLGDALAMNTGVVILNLSYNYLGPLGASRIAEGLCSNQKLADLNLQGNGIGPIGAEALGSALRYQHSALRNLNVSGCCIRNKGVAFIASALMNKSCEVEGLHLARNFISAAAVKGLTEMISVQHSLKRLGLACNALSQEAMDVLRVAWDGREGTLDVADQQPCKTVPEEYVTGD